MSIPAVLYDHVPMEDLHHDGNTQNETGGESFYVSSMVHRSSAPRKQDDDGNCNNGDKNTKQFVEHGKGSNNKNNDGVITKKDGENEYEKDTEFIGIDIDIDIDIENDESDDRPMETIIEDIDSYYVLIPIPPPTMTGDHNRNSSFLTGASQRTTSRISTRIRSYGKALFRAATRSPKSKWDRTTNFWKANEAVAKCLSGCASGTRVILKPLQSYATALVSSSYSIYSSYDWVSETVIDGSGNRLILPGSCVALDSDDSRNRTTNDGRRENSKDNHDTGVLIVPEGLDAVGLDGRSQSSGGIPVAQLSSSSSLWWTSNTIMVSAHDLLAVKHDQRMQLRDRNGPRLLSFLDAIEEEEKEKSDYNRYYYRDDEYNMDRPTIIVATTQTIVQQWTRALCTLAQRKANMWYTISRSYLRRSIRNTRRLCISYSQQFFIQYYKSNDRRRCRSLSMSLSNNNFANSEANTWNINQYENRGGEHDPSRLTVSSGPPQKLSDRSYDYNQSSDKKINEYEVTARGSDYICIIEMATPMSKSQNG